MTNQAELLTPPYNYAVVQLPDRKYPGVVLQGDTLHSLVVQIADLRKLFEDRDLDNLGDEISSLLEDFSAIQKSYEKVCAERGIELPYPR